MTGVGVTAGPGGRVAVAALPSASVWRPCGQKGRRSHRTGPLGFFPGPGAGDQGAKLEVARRAGVVTFEADDLEPALRVGWSVLVMGRCRS